MRTRDVREIPKQDPPLTGYVIVILEQPVDDNERRRRSRQALARIRRRRRKLPPGAPDAVAMLRKMRGYED
jgi:hypothetical protein